MGQAAAMKMCLKKKKKIKVNLQIQRTETTLGTKIKIVPPLGRGNKQWHTHTMEC